jgi:hypothetical protein
MAGKGRPKRSNPQAERKIFRAELSNCLVCGEPLTSVGNVAHSAKTVQTFEGEFHVVAYSRLCDNPQCDKCGHHYHAVGHLRVALPYETYGLDIVAFIGWQRDRGQRRFSEITLMLNHEGIVINERSVGRLYRLYQALLKGCWKKVQERLEQAEQEYGGLILAADGLQPDGCGGTLYVLYEVLSGTPVHAMWIEVADTVHLTDWLRPCPLADFKVLATMSDHEEALVKALTTVYSEAPHQLCQEHFISRLSEPIHEADQKLQATLQEQLRNLPKPPKLTVDESAESVAAESMLHQSGLTEEHDGVQIAEETQMSALPSKTEPQSEDTTEKQSHRPEPLLKNLLFPRTPLQPIDPELGIPVSLESVLWNHYYRYYRTAVQDALHRSRRKPFQTGGLDGYDQLAKILTHLEQRNQVYGTDLFLDSLTTRVQQAIETARTQAEDVRQARTFLQQVEHFLAHAPRPAFPNQARDSEQEFDGGKPEPAVQTENSGRAWVEQKLRQMFNQFAQQSDLGPTGQRLCRKWHKMSQTWLPGILHCYEIPALPRSNLELEAVYGTLRSNQRRISGRKETSPLRLFGAGEAMALIIDTEEELLEWCQIAAEDKETYQSQRRLQEEREERQRWLRRLHRDPDKAMTQVDEQFYAVLKELGLTPVMKLTDT